jgi:hypothetical protein
MEAQTSSVDSLWIEPKNFQRVIIEKKPYYLARDASPPKKGR